MQEPGGWRIRPTTFEWGDAIVTCLVYSLAAGIGSMMLETVLGLVAASTYRPASNSFSGNVWVLFFIAFLVPCIACGFFVGNRVRSHGWAVGLIAVAMWGLVWRPLYAFVFRTVLGGNLTSAFTSTFPYHWVLLALTFFLFLPLGALTGWAGEYRARTKSRW